MHSVKCGMLSILYVLVLFVYQLLSTGGHLRAIVICHWLIILLLL